MHQGCVQQPYQDDCGGVLCFLHYPNLRKEACGEEDGCGAVDDGGDDSKDNMDIPIPNATIPEQQSAPTVEKLVDAAINLCQGGKFHG